MKNCGREVMNRGNKLTVTRQNTENTINKKPYMTMRKCLEKLLRTYIAILKSIIMIVIGETKTAI